MPIQSHFLHIIFRIFIAALIFVVASCTKEDELSHYAFSSLEREWMNYKLNDKISFRNQLNEHIVYTVTSIDQGFKAEYDWVNPTILRGETEFYTSLLIADRDSIRLGFYKEIQGNSNPHKLRLNILWTSFQGQLVRLSSIENATPLRSLIIGGKNYSQITDVFSEHPTSNQFTKWTTALYDRKDGFVQLTDINGNEWWRD